MFCSITFFEKIHLQINNNKLKSQSGKHSKTTIIMKKIYNLQFSHISSFYFDRRRKKWGCDNFVSVKYKFLAHMFTFQKCRTI